MRYAQGGGLTPRQQQARERIRLEAGARFARGEKTAVVAAELRVGVRQVEKWRRTWREGGPEALRSKGPVSVERLSPVRWERLERELARGPLAHGRDEGQGWTLVRVKTVIGRLFHVGYTVQGVWRLLRRHGWSVRVPASPHLPPDPGRPLPRASARTPRGRSRGPRHPAVRGDPGAGLHRQRQPADPLPQPGPRPR
jgi:transposase